MSKWNKEVPPTLARQNLYPCDLNVYGWQRCADDTGTDQGANGVGQALKRVGLGSGVGAGTDLVGFSANLSGNRSTYGSFLNLGSYLLLWSSTPYSSTSAWSRYLNTSYSTVYRNAFNMVGGFSIRCLRDTDDTSDFTDPRDGNVYECVKIGKQVWMTENLRYLPSVNAPNDGSETESKYYVYDYNGTDVATAKATANYIENGTLYNYPAAMISAPTGFHLPSDEELNILEKYVMGKISDSNPFKTLIDFDSTSGIIKDRTGKNNLTATDVSIKKIGQSYSADFNGATSGIDLGTTLSGLTSSYSICGWIKPYTFGESNAGHILSNEDRFNLFISTSNNSLGFSRDGSTVVYSANNSIDLNKWTFFYVASENNGTTNIYLSSLDSAPALSGTANQASGTPTAGTTNVIIGNNSGTTRTFDGNISELKIIEGILDIQTITQIWSESRKNYI